MTVKKQFNSFEEMLNNTDSPILVDFYATWCGPCQMMASELEQVNIVLGQRLKIVKIDTDKYPQIASKYQVQALPTLMLFKEGRPVEKMEGAMPAHQLIPHLENFL
ncbi:MAG: thioredoxin [Microcoleaceae cyanobacterium]